jgi:hypothetical protein
MRRRSAYFLPMRTLAVVVPLLALLALAIWFAVGSWSAMEGPPMPLIGWLALAGGAFFSLVIGCGLMALMFYSHRHGHDDLTIDPEERRGK